MFVVFLGKVFQFWGREERFPHHDGKKTQGAEKCCEKIKKNELVACNSLSGNWDYTIPGAVETGNSVNATNVSLPFTWSDVEGLVDVSDNTVLFFP